ncbi:hypothetical protein FNT36_13105 [Hymenobacter setariae]|uniref:Right-handed parallel beta-helix repeat-containing protein n=1 Tax=Hymenobacter setariae TaxID=2594794 RepID=A0A558BVA9_9BACT|nr:hypothetical protein [Hymenobacter setariae]TVT40412.1 hypothetical protein FNT36_13105 [Hymenobacter setariae]
MFKKLLFPVLLLLSAGLSLTMPGCKPREEELQMSGALEFSADTVKFDTVFTTLRTVTKRLWVYNRNPKGVNVDLISLEKPAASAYTLLINGDLKQTANNLFIRGQDSLLILVRAKLPDNGQNGSPKDYVLEEKLNFRTNGQDQQVLLRSFGQNIYLHDGSQLTGNLTWTNDRPHVLYRGVVVPAGSTLRLKPGTRVYAHAGAALIVRGTLLVNSPADYAPGTAATDTVKATNANIVRFGGDRSGEALYATAPGQWTGIVLDASSHGNIIRYAQIQNAAVGVLVYNPTNASPRPDVLLQNSVIRYISGADVSFAGSKSSLEYGAGVLSVGGKVTMENTLLSDCYEYALLGTGGGEYSLNYCTIANYPAITSVRNTASLTFSNTSADGKTKVLGLTLSLKNSIVWGSNRDELSLENYDEYSAGVSIQNTMLATQLYAATTNAPDKPGLAQPSLNNLIGTYTYNYPRFKSVSAGRSSDYRLDITSPGVNRGAQKVQPLLPRDLLNLPRPDAQPALGAYQTTK